MNPVTPSFVANSVATSVRRAHLLDMVDVTTDDGAVIIEARIHGEWMPETVTLAVSEAVGSYYGTIVPLLQTSPPVDRAVIDLVGEFGADIKFRYELPNEWVRETSLGSETLETLLVRVLSSGHVIDEDGVPRSNEEFFAEILEEEGIDVEEVDIHAVAERMAYSSSSSGSTGG